jgi:hypothetical protein
MRGAWDLLAYDVNAHIYKRVQVKALSKRNPVRLGNTLDKFMGDWWIIVTNAGTTNPVCFIMKPKRSEATSSQRRKGRSRFLLAPAQSVRHS